MAAGDIYGKVDCLVCGHCTDLKETKAGKPCYTCGNCQVQVFGRGQPSCSMLISKVKKEVKPVENEDEEASGLLGWI